MPLLKAHRMNWTEDGLLNPRRIRPSQRATEELRGEFDRDYGRVLYSTPVRRLKDKAQVFPLESHDAVRTRLAHSLEVSSVARTLGAQAGLFVASQQKLEPIQVRQIEAIAATCGLIHDLGNPPFGHAGELAISTWFEDKLKVSPGFLKSLGGRHSQRAQDFLRFEGNAQTLRLISHLQILSDNTGLNLTFGTLSAASKYLAPSHRVRPKTSHSRAKPGYFVSEEEVVTLIRQKTGTRERRNPITFLVEAADDIVYSTVDIEDGVKKGVLDWRLVEEKITSTALGRKALHAAHKQIDPAHLTGKPSFESLAQAFRIWAITLMASAVLDVFRERYIIIMDGQYDGELIKDENCAAADLVSNLKAILKDQLYTDSSILKLEVRGRKVIHELMTLFWEAVRSYPYKENEKTRSYPAKLYLLISENYRRVFEERFESSKTKEDKMYCRLQLVTDQIVGMTDAYACRLHKELTNG